MPLELNWQTGTPEKEDLYLVAIKLGDNSGYFAFSDWNGREWSQTYPENIIAFYPASELVRAAAVVWPEPPVDEPVDDLDMVPPRLEDFEEDLP